MVIEVTAATRKLAILGIFRDVFAAGAPPLRLPQLRAAWNSSGLRGGDLESGLEELVQDGTLTRVEAGDEAAFALTAQGAHWVSGPYNVLEWLGRRRELRMLRRLRQRMGQAPAGEAVLMLRRDADRTTMAQCI